MIQLKLHKAFLLIALVFCLSVQNVLGQAPTITGFTPVSGSIGSTITIMGTNFSATPDDNIVVFGTTRATVSAATTTQLSVNVPMGATHEFISVLNTATGLLAYSSAKFIPTYTPSSSTITADDFSPAATFPINDGIQGNIALSDLDGDGKTDLVIMGHDTLSVFRNTSAIGTVSSDPRMDFPAHIQSAYVSIGDFDGDGKPDIVSFYGVVDVFISVYRNTSTVGTISFAEREDYALGYYDYLRGAPAIGDLDGDGKADIVTTAYSGGDISIFKNTSTVGAISFASRMDINPGYLYHDRIAIGDLDGDGKPELAVNNHFSASVTVLRNTSEVDAISFASPTHFTTAPYPQDISIGDIDGDGKLDLAVMSYQFYISLFKNTSTTGTITFAERIDIYIAVNSSTIPLGDINGDGKLDIVMTDESYNNIFIFRNTSEVDAISYDNHIVIDYGQIDRMVIADVDGDGMPELVGILPNSSSISVLRNSPMGLSIPDVEDSSNFTLYPNPANHQIVITSKVNLLITGIEIIDVSGRVIQSIDSDFENEFNLDVSRLSAGNYFLKLQSEKGIAIKKFIKI